MQHNDTPGNHFAILPEGTLVSTLFTYTGVQTAGQAGPRYLQYDGHPGYDYGFGENTAVYAAADGDIMTDVDFNGSNIGSLGMPSYYMDRYHALIIKHKGFCSIYMHLSSIETNYVDESNPDSWKPVKCHVLAGAKIGNTGNFDKLANPPLGFHFHFEVWRLDPGNNWNYIDPYGFSGVGADGVTIVQISKPLWTGH